MLRLPFCYDVEVSLLGGTVGARGSKCIDENTLQDRSLRVPSCGSYPDRSRVADVRKRHPDGISFYVREGPTAENVGPDRGERMKREHLLAWTAVGVTAMVALGLAVLLGDKTSSPDPPIRTDTSLGRTNQLISQGWKAVDADELTDALALFDEAIKSKPRSSDAYNGRGWAYHCIGEESKALEDFERAIKLRPGNAVAVNNRGVINRNFHNYDAAIADFTRAIELAPRHVLAHVNRGFVSAIKGETEKAFKDFQRAITMNPRSAEAYTDRGATYCFALKDRDRALADFNHAVWVRPRHYDAYLNRGVLFFNEGKYQAAARDFRTALELKPKDAYAVLWLYLTLKRSGENGEEVLEAYAKQYLPGRPKLTVSHAIELHLGRKSPDEFLAAIVTNVEEQTGVGRLSVVNFHLGAYWWIRGRKETARHYLRQCVAAGVKDYHEHLSAEAALQLPDEPEGVNDAEKRR